MSAVAAAEATANGEGLPEYARAGEPGVVVVSSLFPSPGNSVPGVFIYERILLIGQGVPLLVVSPRPWSPMDGIVWRLCRGIRIAAPGKWRTPECGRWHLGEERKRIWAHSMDPYHEAYAGLGLNSAQEMFDV